jgi:hypothetical protein
MGYYIHINCHLTSRAPGLLGLPHISLSSTFCFRIPLIDEQPWERFPFLDAAEADLPSRIAAISAAGAVHGFLLIDVGYPRGRPATRPTLLPSAIITKQKDG